MPKFRLSLYLSNVNLQFFFVCNQEAQLGWDAEVRNGKEWNFFKYTVTPKLSVNLLFAVKIADSQGSDLHDIANIEQIEPFRLVEISK